MNQADVSKLVSQLRVRVNPKARRIPNPQGPEGRLHKLRHTVSGLIKYERIELNSSRAEEARNYAERLISDAIRYGDADANMMEMADFWLEEKQLVHKLFKVLVPRFQNSTLSYTKIFRAPGRAYPINLDRLVVELRGNPFPPLTKDLSHNRNLLHNVLLDAAKREFRRQQYEKVAKGVAEKAAAAAKDAASQVASDAAQLEDGHGTTCKSALNVETPLSGENPVSDQPISPPDKNQPPVS